MKKFKDAASTGSVVMALVGIVGITMMMKSMMGCSSSANEELGQSSAALRRGCDLGSLKGTYSFDAVGYAPAPPPGVIQDETGRPLDIAVNFGSVIPLHAIGHVTFDGNGVSTGYIHENVGGIFEDSVPFNGTYELAPGPQGVGCQGKWILQDRHRLIPFNEEGPHKFRITLARESSGFHFITEGGGPGPVTLSGFAPLDLK